MTQFIDLSVPMETNDGEPQSPHFVRISHRKGAEEFCAHVNAEKKRFLGKKLNELNEFNDGSGVSQKITPDDFPGGEFLANEIVTAGVHSGTHMDAPYHYGSRCAGRESRTIDQIPLAWFFGHGVVLDLSWKPPRSAISREDIVGALQRIAYNPRERDIVLIRTGSDKHWGTPAYFTDYPGMGADAVRYLVERGVRVMGIDSYGFDRPFSAMIADYLRKKEKGDRQKSEKGDRQILWPAHFLGRELEYCHMERMANLDAIPRAYGFKIACFPVKIAGAGAAWVRPVAIIETNKKIIRRTKKNFSRGVKHGN